MVGSDRGKVGTVNEVHAGEGVPYMTVAAGLLGIGDKLHIPLEAVAPESPSQACSSHSCGSSTGDRCDHG